MTISTHVHFLRCHSWRGPSFRFECYIFYVAISNMVAVKVDDFNHDGRIYLRTDGGPTEDGPTDGGPTENG